MSSRVHETKTNAIFKKGVRCSQLRALATVHKEERERDTPTTHTP
jgi:hypothetical protein